MVIGNLGAKVDPQGGSGENFAGLTRATQFEIALKPKLLEEGAILQFSDAWPPAQHLSVSGKTFKVQGVNAVPHILSYVLPGGDYRDVNLSSGTDLFQENIYPERTRSLFEVSLGLSKGDWLLQLLIPESRPHLVGLEYAAMRPNVDDSQLRFLGTLKPESSPREDPTIRLFFVKNLSGLILRLYVLDSVDWEKIILSILVNRVNMVPIMPSGAEERKAEKLSYYTELRF